MELPRYRSQSITQLASQSPQEAAAGAGAMGQALAQGLDVVAQVTAKIQGAEADAAAQAALTDVELQTKQFLADPRWSQAELTDANGNAVPTDQVMQEEWKAFSSRLLAENPKIRDRTAKSRYDQGKRQLLVGAEIEVAGQRRKLAVERGKALTDYAAEARAQMGDFAGAAQRYEEGIAAGLYSTAEYLERSKKLQILEVEQGYMGRMGPDAQDVDLPALGEEILSDGRLPASNRRSLFRTLVSETERRDRAETRQRTQIQRENAASLWENLNDLTIPAIVASDLRPEDKTALIKARRALELEGVDDPSAVAEVSRLTAGLSNGSATRDDVQSAITRHMEQGSLSPQTGTKLLTNLTRTDDALWNDTRFDRLQREGELAINKGVASDQLIAMFAKDEAQQRAQLGVEWRQAFLNAKMEGGTGFDAEAWYRTNLPKFMERSKAIAATQTSTTFAAYGVRDKEGRVDLLATKKRIDDALASGALTPLQHQDAYREFRLDQ